MASGRICIVDDEPLTRKSLYEVLRYAGYTVSCVDNGRDALALIAQEHPDVVVTDLKMPQMSGIELLKKIKEIEAEAAVVLVTAYGSIDTAVDAMKNGAFDYITKPIQDTEIKIVIERIFDQKRILEENKTLKKRLAKTTRSQFHNLIGQNQAMQKIYDLIETIAPTNAGIFIQGESGTGKRLVAQAIHYSDPLRKDKPFIEVSCGALPENLLESELFGHVKGSFTSAIKDRQGRFEAADSGTIFLDEIDAFSLKLQVKLLRVLQEGEFERVGDTGTLKVDVRVIAATNQDLKKLIKENLFREDLYYRLNVIPVEIPPLRKRKDDLPLLVEHFLRKCSNSNKIKKEISDVSGEVIRILGLYDWPGNVRELENIVERAVILCRQSKIEKEDLPEFLQELAGLPGAPDDLKNKECVLLKNAMKCSEKETIQNALNVCGGNRNKTAQVLGINRTTLYNKMKEYGLLRKDADPDLKNEKD
jgi:DNA-binding NtrC family response regulator